jgi:hypothetical protein
MAAMPVPARSESAATEGTGSETEAVPNPSESSPPSEDPAASSSAPIDERVQREPAATDPEAAEPLGVAPEEAAPEDEFLPTEEVNQTLERRWTDAVDSVAEKVQTGERTAADADALFVELVKDLRREMTKLREYVREDGAATERVIEKYARVREMYETRIRLLDLVSPEFRKLVTGAGPEGVDELRLELRVLATHLVYQTLRIPHDVSQRIADARVAPIPAVSDGLKLLVALGLFFTWRRWAKRELPGIQSRLGMARFRDPSFGRMERVVAFVRRVRNPLEWMFLSSALFAVLSLGHAADLEAVAATVVWWFLIAWLAVSVGRAVMARRFKSTDEELEKLRTRSLRLIAAWLLVIGMGLSIAADVTGRGTLYAWVWRAFFALTIPTVVALVVWWRSRIFNALVFEAERSNFAAGLVKNRHGLGGSRSSWRRSARRNRTSPKRRFPKNCATESSTRKWAISTASPTRYSTQFPRKSDCTTGLSFSSASAAPENPGSFGESSSGTKAKSRWSIAPLTARSRLALDSARPAVSATRTSLRNLSANGSRNRERKWWCWKTSNG